MPDDHTSFFVQARSASRLLSGLGFQAAARAHFIERQLPLALKKSSSCAGAGKYRVEGSLPADESRLLVPQGLDRVQAGGLYCRHEAEDDADQGRECDCYHAGRDRDRDRRTHDI